MKNITKNFNEILDANDMDMFVKKVTGLVASKIGGHVYNYQDVEDISIEVTNKVYSSINKYDKNRSNINTFMYTLVDTKLKDVLRLYNSNKNLISTNAVIAEDDDIDASELIDNISFEDDSYVLKEYIIDILSTKSISTKAKHILKLKLDGYTDSEIANLFKCSSAYISKYWKKTIKNNKKAYKIF